MRKTRSGSRFLFYFAILAILIAFGMIVFANGKKWYERRKQEKNIQAIEQEIARLKKEEEQNRRLLEELQSPFFIEREGREKLGAKKPGEKIVLFPKFDDMPGNDNGGEREEKHPPFFKNWLQYFFHPVTSLSEER